MNEKVLTDDDGRPYMGRDVLYREKGVTALDVQRAADALLRRGQKPSIAAVREELGGGSPNNLARLLEKYWKGLGTRLPSGSGSLERVPESLARMTEVLWLRSLDEARERAKASLIGASPAQREVAAIQGTVTALTAALAESRARASELEAQLLASLRDRVELRGQVQKLTALLSAEQELLAQAREVNESRRREVDSSRDELLALTRRRLAARTGRSTVRRPPRATNKVRHTKPSSNQTSVPVQSRSKQVRTGAAKRGRPSGDAKRTVHPKPPSRANSR